MVRDVQHGLGDTERRRVHGVGEHDGPNRRVSLIDRGVSERGPTRAWAHFVFATADQHEVADVQCAAVTAGGCNEKRCVVQAGGKAAFRADQQSLSASASNERTQFASQFLFDVAVAAVGSNGCRVDAALVRLVKLLIREVPHRSQLDGLDHRFRGELECLKPLERRVPASRQPPRHHGSRERRSSIPRETCRRYWRPSCSLPGSA